MLTLVSCSKSAPQSPLEAIPAGAKQIAVINLDELAEANGANKIAASGHLLPEVETAVSAIFPDDLQKPLSALLASAAEAVDTKEATLFTASNGYSGIIFKIIDGDRLSDSQLSTFRDKSQDFGDYEVYSVGRRMIAVSDALCVIAPDESTIKSVGSKDSQKFMADMPGVKGFLSGDNTIKIATLATNFFGKEMQGLWLCGDIHFTESTAVATVSAMQPDGTVDQLGTRIAAPINLSVAPYIPEGCSLVLATGKQDGNNKTFNLADLLTKYIPGQSLISANGTTAMYLRPAGSLNAFSLMLPDRWDCAIIAEGETPNDFSTYSLSEEEITNNNSNNYTDEFQGTRLAMIIDIPQKSDLQTAIGLPCGASFTLKVTDDNIHAKLALYGNSQPVLATITNIPLLKMALPYIAGLK
jgi:hypothetical protein